MDDTEKRNKNLFDKTLLHPIFDRQMRIPKWNQKKMEEQVALCLGIGGLGSQVCIALCRLGIKKMIIVDYDVVDEHNLNRQLLYGKKHVNVMKVEAAKQTLEDYHNIRTEIVPINMNVLEKWDQVVKAVSESTVVFNMIDVGEKYDDCVQALCYHFKIPMLNGGTFQNLLTFDYCDPQTGPCLVCMKMSGKVDEEYVKKVQPEEVVKYERIDHFVKPEKLPVGASNVLVASTCSNFMVSLWVNAMMEEMPPSRVIFYLNCYDVVKWKMEKNENCYICGKKE